MSTFLNLPLPPLPPHLATLRAAALRQEPGSGFSTNIRPLRTRRTAAATSHGPDPLTNETMLQGFEWYVPADGAHWRRLARVLPALAGLGVSKLWIPPACKAASSEGNGYDLYDLWDLGEFEQKGGVATKWGTKGELEGLVEVAGGLGVRVLFDAVLNHKTGADFREGVYARRVDEKDRRVEVSTESEVGKTTKVETMLAWTGFNFPGRDGRYSKMKWKNDHFTGVDYDYATKKHGIWKLEGKEWADDVDEELGNYDFLWVSLPSDPEVRLTRRTKHVCGPRPQAS